MISLLDAYNIFSSPFFLLPFRFFPSLIFLFFFSFFFFFLFLGTKLVWFLKFRQWFCRPSFETALALEEIPWRIGDNSSPLFPLVVFILPSDDQGGLNERGEGRALTPLCPMVKDYPQSFFGMKPSKTPHIRFFINPAQPQDPKNRNRQSETKWPLRRRK